MLECGLFTPADIKTRSYEAEDFCVGAKGRDGSFIHVSVWLLEGRTNEQKGALTGAIKANLCGVLKNVDQVSVDIQDMVRDTYRKC